MNLSNSMGSHGWIRRAVAVLMALGCAASVQAQSDCGGAITLQSDPATSPADPIPFTGFPGFAQALRITLTPSASATSPDIAFSQVDFALACADNGDEVPCTSGNDLGATSGVVPIEFVGNVDGTCGATSAASPGGGGAGTVTFTFPEVTVGTAGCTVAFDVMLRDIGTDASPDVLTSAANFTGRCPANSLAGSGRGSLAIFLDPVPAIEIVKEISVDGGATWFDANDIGSAPSAFVPAGAQYRLRVSNTGASDLTSISITDAQLGLSSVPVSDLAVGESIILDAGTAGFAALSVPDACSQAGSVVNTASVQGTSVSDSSTVQDSDPATLICVGEARSVPVMNRAGLMILISLLAALALTAVRGRI